jgi:hypothetical protein
LLERVGFGMERSEDSMEGGLMRTWRRTDDVSQSGDDEVSQRNWKSGTCDRLRRTSWWGMVVVGK